MSEFLEMVKSRMLEAQRRLQDITQKLQALQAEHQRVGQEAASWQRSFESETRREADRQGIATVSVEPKIEEGRESEVNKTALVRDLILQLNGLTPVEIWKAVGHQLGRRQYMYAVLGRLKDRDAVVVRRGKYFLKSLPSQKTEIEENGMIQ